MTFSRCVMLASAIMLAGTAGGAEPVPRAIENDIREAMRIEAYGERLNLALAERARLAGNPADAALHQQAAATDRAQFSRHLAMLDMATPDDGLREALGAALEQGRQYSSAKFRARALQNEAMADHFQELDGIAAQQRDRFGEALKAPPGGGR